MCIGGGNEGAIFMYAGFSVAVFEIAAYRAKAIGRAGLLLILAPTIVVSVVLSQLGTFCM